MGCELCRNPLTEQANGLNLRYLLCQIAYGTEIVVTPVVIASAFCGAEKYPTARIARININATQTTEVTIGVIDKRAVSTLNETAHIIVTCAFLDHLCTNARTNTAHHIVERASQTLALRPHSGSAFVKVFVVPFAFECNHNNSLVDTYNIVS